MMSYAVLGPAYSLLLMNYNHIHMLKSQTTSERRVETKAEAEANAEQETPRREAEEKAETTQSRDET